MSVLLKHVREGIVCAAAVMVLLTLAITPAGAQVTTNTYNVGGTTLEEVWEDIEDKGFSEGGSVHAGAAMSTLGHMVITLPPQSDTIVKPDCPGGMGVECTVTWTVSYAVTTVLTLPSFPGAADLCDEAKAEWERFAEALETHEEGHHQIAVDALAAANPVTMFTTTQMACNLPDCLMLAEAELQSQLDAELTRLQTAIDDAGEQYDTDTNHGATQGATLDTSITCPAPPEEELQDIIDEFDFLGLNTGLQNSLTMKLKNAIASIEKGNTKAAKNQINAFIKEVKAKSGKKKNGIDKEVADDFIERATQARNRL